MASKGFTLLELLFGLLIAVVLAVMALPNYQKLIANSKVSNLNQQLLSAIHLARSEAISSRRDVILCGSSTGSACDNLWSLGFMVFIDKNSNSQFDDDLDSLLQTSQSTDERLSLTWRSFRGNRPVRFLPTGITWHFNGTFRICYDQKPKHAKWISMTKSGRARVSKDTDGDGIDEDRDGNPIGCN